MRTAQELYAFYAPHYEHMPELEYYAQAPLMTALRFNQWQCVLRLPPPDQKMKTTAAIWHFGRALAFAQLGDMDKAQEELRLFNEKKALVPEETLYGFNTASAILKIASLLLDARFAELSGDPARATRALELAVNAQDMLHYNEPPDWFFPIRENLGGLLLRLKQYADAEAVFRKDLDIHPRNGRSLFGLKESLMAQNRNYDAWWVNGELEKAWRYSDTPLNLQNL